MQHVNLRARLVGKVVWFLHMAIHNRLDCIVKCYIPLCEARKGPNRTVFHSFVTVRRYGGGEGGRKVQLLSLSVLIVFFTHKTLLN